MTLDEARAGIRRKVVYQPRPGMTPEEGVITSVNDRYVFVRYGTSVTPAATWPADIEFLAAG